jgi:hypothetical protein
LNQTNNISILTSQFSTEQNNLREPPQYSSPTTMSIQIFPHFSCILNFFQYPTQISSPTLFLDINNGSIFCCLRTCVFEMKISFRSVTHAAAAVADETVFV